MLNQESAARSHFEYERNRSAFLSFLAGAGIGIIATDTWVAHWAGVPGGLLIGLVAAGIVFSYETLMWRRQHGS